MSLIRVGAKLQESGSHEPDLSITALKESLFLHYGPGLSLRLELTRVVGNFRCALRFSVWSLQAADQWQ